MSTLEELGTYLDSDTSLTLGTDLFLGIIPETPNICVGLYEYGASAPMDFMTSAQPSIEMPRIQATIRGEEDTYATTKALAQTVWLSLSKLRGSTLSGTQWLRAQPLDSPTFLARDETYRPIFVANFQVFKAIS